MRAEDFIEKIKRYVLDTIAQYSPFKLGTIPSTYTTGRPQVQFDGETSPSTRTYPYLASYPPAANDRVLVAKVGNAGVVLGKVV